jgi:hypothetical protein
MDLTQLLLLIISLFMCGLSASPVPDAQDGESLVFTGSTYNSEATTDFATEVDATLGMDKDTFMATYFDSSNALAFAANAAESGQWSITVVVQESCLGPVFQYQTKGYSWFIVRPNGTHYEFPEEKVWRFDGGADELVQYLGQYKGEGDGWNRDGIWAGVLKMEKLNNKDRSMNMRFGRESGGGCAWGENDQPKEGCGYCLTDKFTDHGTFGDFTCDGAFKNRVSYVDVHGSSIWDRLLILVIVAANSLPIRRLVIRE